VERFSRYVAWAAGDHEKALALYTLNIRLSEALYTPLQILEIALRNRIHAVLSTAYGERWFDIEGLLQVHHQHEQLGDVISHLHKEGKDPTPGRVVAALTFSYWTAMVSPAYEALWRSTLHSTVVRSDGKRLSRKQLSRQLTPIRVLRNRIAHHEPILHWNLRKHHNAMSEITAWLSPAVAAWCLTIDRFPSVFPIAGYRLQLDGEEQPS
jgi:Abi-like protein